MVKILVIGGGAAGFFGAIAAAEAYPPAQVTILDGGRDPLGKVKISGGGRCNVTHHCFDPAQLVMAYPRGGRALRGAFSRFQPQDTIAWFARHGVTLKAEADGRMFPDTDDSATIVHCLTEAARRSGVRWRSGVMVQGVYPSPQGWTVTLKGGESLQGDRLLIATGGHPSGHRLAAQLGHHLQTAVPSLFTLAIRDERLKDLAGVAVDPVRVEIAPPGGGKKDRLEQLGPVLVTHWGLSGPAILKLSAWGARLLHDHHYQLPLRINWLPDHNPASLETLLRQTQSQHPKKQIATFLPLSFPKRLWQSLIRASGIGGEQMWADLSKKQWQALIRELLQGEYAIAGKGIFKEEFVTCGGIDLKEIDFKTMESRRCPGLYFAGEVLDIDGITGGFNFQSAWTTGWIAGQAMVQNHSYSNINPTEDNLKSPNT